jgi:mannitol-1-/sugar-/sorbitol-6-phosphatase
MIIETKGLLFDNDGVLVDSHPAAKAAWDQWSKEYGQDFDIDQNAGRRAQDLVLAMVGADLFEVANDRINQLEQDTANETVALGGAVKLLHSLTPGTWTVCTSANKNLGRARLAAAGLPIPAELVTADDVELGKPNPDPYLLGASRLGLAAGECVVFEDAEAGVKSGRAAGVAMVIGVSERALETSAEIVIRDLSAVTFVSGQLYIPDENRLR